MRFETTYVSYTAAGAARQVNDVAGGVLAGFMTGAASGLLGVSPGGILVPVAILLLGCDQHAAQGISLVAQIPPTSAAGIKRYWDKGNQIPMRWLAILAIGFVLGGVFGAIAAGKVADTALRWTFVGYLMVLDLLLIIRALRPSRNARGERERAGVMALFMTGAIAGLSSGFMGIGGGLAITVCLTLAMNVAQHRAQMAGLAVSLLPLTIPSAWIYWRQGWSVPWLVVGSVVAGLWIGTDIGARLANRLVGQNLRWILIGLVTTMVLYMSYKSWEH
jgi:uncharacterized membrane protein YfcA